jgi:hypothetical protein
MAHCGPSLRTSFERERAFEHCYVLDQRADSTLAERGSCWKLWLDRHSATAGRDRREYASAQASLLYPELGVPDSVVRNATEGDAATDAAVILAGGNRLADDGTLDAALRSDAKTDLVAPKPTPSPPTSRSRKPAH